MKNHIDTTKGLDVNKFSYEDIRWIISTGQSKSYGTGRKKTYSYRNGVMTKIGDVEVSVWADIAYQVVLAHDDSTHLAWLAEILLKYDYGKRYTRINGKTELHYDALSLCVSQIHNNPEWVLFMEYNQTYRPEFLTDIPLVTITTECCENPVDIPVAQTNREVMSCPFCGRFSAYSLI